MEQTLSSPTPAGLRAWRIFFESALALMDLLGTELEQAVGIPMRWYDVLVQLEESPEGLPMNVLAERILHSKSGFTRIVDRMEEEGLVSRVRPKNDRRTILVVLTEEGRETMKGTAATIETASSNTLPRTSPTRTSNASRARSRRSAHTLARSAPAASAVSARI